MDKLHIGFISKFGRIQVQKYREWARKKVEKSKGWGWMREWEKESEREERKKTMSNLHRLNVKLPTENAPIEEVEEKKREIA